MRVRSVLPLLAVTALWLLSGGPPISAEPSFDGGAYIGSDACFECHEAAELNMDRNVHMRVESFEVWGAETGCEGCHGAGQRHMEEGDPALIRTFATGADGEACMTCHERKNVPEWKTSVHYMEGVSCTSCHSSHTKSNPNRGCAECHADSVARFQLPSHHPLREGKMDCDSCHDVHGATDFMLKSRMRKNDVCYQCHQAIEGPFIFEHSPVEEDCSICHEAHGSPANNLLVANEPMLCLQCHDFHFHAGYRASDDDEVDVGGIERENPFGPQGLNIAYTTNCTQCHSRVHGSDSPSQTVPGSGKGRTH